MTEPSRLDQPEEAREERPCAVLGIIVAPGLAHEVTARIAAELLEDLRERYGSVDWRTELEVDRLVVPPARPSEIFAAGRRKLLEGDWDLGVVVTDLPLNVGGRAVSRQLSPTHGLAVLSLPALGAIHLRPRLRRALVQLIDELAGRDSGERWEDNVLRELATDAVDRHRLLYVPAVLAGNLRLLLGMIRANRPWRFAARLYGALVAALAVGAYSVVSSDVWRLSDAMGWWRLALMCAASIAGTALAVVWAHGLWERAPDRRVREQVVLFNLTTSLTVAIGIACLYLALFVLIFAAAELIVRSSVFSSAVGHGVATSDYLALAWFAASFATVAGGLGAGLESREAVREAAYTSSVGDETAGCGRGLPVDPLSLLWLFFILASLQPALQRQVLAARRRQSLAALSRKRNATVITLIHRQETVSLLGIPLARYIDIETRRASCGRSGRRPSTGRSRSSSTRRAGSCWPRPRSPPRSPTIPPR